MLVYVLPSMAHHSDVTMRGWLRTAPADSASGAVGRVNPVRFLGVMVLVRAGAWFLPIVS